jgi:uncharacterized protein
MLIARTSVGLSHIKGLGLFAAEFIPARTVVWRKTANNPLRYTPESFAKLPERMRDFILFYGFMDIDSGEYQVDIDNARFVNHSEYPNVFNSRNEIEMIARVDIHPGDEITINYRRVDKMASPELIDQYPYRHFLRQG